MALPAVTIILLNMDGLKFTPSCITSLIKNTIFPFRLIVEDMASTDGSREWLREHEDIPNLKVIYNDKQDGFSRGNNIALEEARGDYVLFLNNDTLVFDPGWLHGLVEEMEYDKTIGICGAKLLYPNNLIQHGGVTFGYVQAVNRLVPFHIGRFEKREKYSEKRVLPAVTFACALVRRELLNEGLDESYGRGNYEDMDFCCKVRKEGHKILYNGEVELYHYEGGTTLRQPQPEWMEHVQRNWIMFSDRWNGWLMEDVKANQQTYGAGYGGAPPQNMFNNQDAEGRA